MLSPWTLGTLEAALGSASYLFPGFLAVFVGVACFFVPCGVSADDGRNMLFFLASRGVAVVLVLVGSFALWQVAIC